MANNDYNNMQGTVLFAPLEENLSTSNGKSFDYLWLDAQTEPVFQQDDVVGKHLLVGQRSYLKIEEDLLAVGTGDLTLYFWAYFIGSYCEVSTRTIRSDLGFRIEVSASSAYVGAYGLEDREIKLSAKQGEWAHYALVRKDGKIYAFANGQLFNTADAPFNLNATVMSINSGITNEPASFCSSSNKYKAVRVSDFARWTDDFVPPDPKDTGDQPSGPIDMKLHILLKVAETVNLTGYLWPLGPNLPTLVWSSENTSIASVNQNGTVTANAVGKTKIFVRTQDNSWSGFARIKVVEEGNDELLLSVLLEVGESCILFPEFEPEELSTAVLWSSSDPAVATVGPTGKVTGIVPGLVTITAQTADGRLTDSMYVTVKP